MAKYQYRTIFSAEREEQIKAKDYSKELCLSVSTLLHYEKETVVRIISNLYYKCIDTVQETFVEISNN